MFFIYKTQNHTWPWKRYVTVLMYIMRCFIGNVCYAFVINVQLFSYPVKTEKKIQQTCFQQYVTCLQKGIMLYIAW